MTARARMPTTTTRMMTMMMMVLLLTMTTVLDVGQADASPSPSPSPSSPSPTPDPCPTPADGGEEEDAEGVGMEVLVHHSDVVVLGKVVRTFPEPGGGGGGDGAGDGAGAGAGAGVGKYRVQMRVFCIYKGGEDVAPMINIAEAGDSSDPCPEHQMEVGKMYMSYLNKRGNSLFTPAFPHHPDTYKDEIFVLCDLNISRPAGGPVDKGEDEVKCEDERPQYDYEESCIRYTPKPPKKGGSSSGSSRRLWTIWLSVWSAVIAALAVPALLSAGPAALRGRTQ
ncbi:uncharacterized protein LOC143299526 [Babylonia areolata]|uniref:uncharacterized protein LOC143299526 n=1 Tax=Babylonia areolata TaxID=304850 RepID=UPI003FD5E50E